MDNMEEQKKEWFETWFDSHYYHVLYKNRDQQEAQSFISQLINYLNPKPNSSVLDLACGKGRHAIQLSESKLNVTGLDLSKNSIASAKQFEKSNLKFDVHDMRMVYRKNAYDFIFSLFTSFGYFNNVSDNVEMLQSVAEQLTPNGIFVLDFLNANVVRANLKEHEIKNVENISFQINKRIENNIVFKDISIQDQEKKSSFQERVQLFNKLTLQNMLLENGLKPIAVFGDYGLNDYDANESSRLILIAEKI